MDELDELKYLAALVYYLNGRIKESQKLLKDLLRAARNPMRLHN